MTTANSHANKIGGRPTCKTRLAPRARELLTERTDGLPGLDSLAQNRHGILPADSAARKLYEGAGKGHFRSVSIREPGQVKGTRLFHLASILAYIEKCERGAADEKAAQEGAVQS